MSLFRASALTAAIALSGLAACGNSQSEIEAVDPSADTAAAAATAPSAIAETEAAPATPAAPATEPATATGGNSGSWAFVAGSIYASGQACGFEQAELDAYKAKARDKVEAMGDGAGFDAAFAQGVKTGQADMAGGAPDARMCELTREALQRG